MYKLCFFLSHYTSIVDNSRQIYNKYENNFEKFLQFVH